MPKFDVAIVGATGVAGQQFVATLQNHPWFRIASLYASQRSAGKKYAEALSDSGIFRWYSTERPEARVLSMEVGDSSQLKPNDVDIIFTAIESEEAKVLEPRLAAERPVISTASAHRYRDDVPILVPGINDEHAKLIDIQRKKEGWKGFVVPIPNCTATGLVISLKPLEVSFGLNTVIMTSMQAVSGAGRSSGVLALDIEDNIIPYIPKEEEKVQTETKKVLGKFNGISIDPLNLGISCTCTRVNVRDGHTESVFISTKKPCSVDEAKTAFTAYSKVLDEYSLPSAPPELIVVTDDVSRPQPRLDRETHDGMATVIGRVRKDEALPNGLKYVLVTHNTKMGAAKGAVLVAELLHKVGYIG